VVEDSGDRFTLKLISAVSPRGDMRFSVIQDKMNEGIGKFVCGSQPEIKDGSDEVERTNTRSERRTEAGSKFGDNR
jgi:hypothetical protein